MKYSTASIQAAHVDGGPVHTVDLEGMDAVGLFDKLRELFPTEDADELDADEDHPEECPARVLLTNPEGFAVHLFDKSKNGDTLWNPSDNFDELLEAWSDESDDDRREAMGEYLDDMGADDLSDFEEAYRGQYVDGAAFAQEEAEGLGAVPTENTWICIDWDATWGRNLRHDYHITDSGHVFRNM